MSIENISLDEFNKRKKGSVIKPEERKFIDKKKCPEWKPDYCVRSLDEEFCKKHNTRPYKRDCSGGSFIGCPIYRELHPSDQKDPVFPRSI